MVQHREYILYKGEGHSIKYELLCGLCFALTFYILDDWTLVLLAFFFVIIPIYFLGLYRKERPVCSFDEDGITLERAFRSPLCIEWEKVTELGDERFFGRLSLKQEKISMRVGVGDNEISTILIEFLDAKVPKHLKRPYWFDQIPEMIKSHRK